MKVGDLIRPLNTSVWEYKNKIERCGIVIRLYTDGWLEVLWNNGGVNDINKRDTEVISASR